MNTNYKFLVLLIVAQTLTACSWIPFFGDDDEVIIELRQPAELEPVNEEVQVKRIWSASAGGSSEDKSGRLRPLLVGDHIATAGENGRVGLHERKSGRAVWNRTLEGGLSGGVGGDEANLVVGNKEGLVYCLNAVDGVERWQARVTSEVVAVSRAQNNLVLVRTHDSRVHALDLAVGNVVWSVARTAPALLLRGASVPLVEDNAAYIGFDNGRVTAVTMDTGEQLWETRVAIPSGRSELERIVDIDGQMLIDEDVLYAVSYQGRIVALAKSNGRVLWARDMSSVSGLAGDEEAVYVSDSDSVIWALEKRSGTVLWKQEKLLYRSLTAPAIIQGNVLVGDFEGYVHVLSREDGRIIGREDISGSALVVPPNVVADQAYLSDQEGRLYSVTLELHN